MSVYRTSTRPQGYDDARVERDPFPTIRCRRCGVRTYSACGEEDCASCDFHWLVVEGIDWQEPTRRSLGRWSFYGVP